jgi:S-adenosylmethionine hydrolase
VRPATITLTTDFGVSDHYVGVMKGVIASINPQANVIDINHEVRPFNVAQGAFFVAQAYRYFPAATVHIAVVDPGVGTSRKPILVEAAGQRFVAPDNGLLSQIYEREPHIVRAIDAERFALKPTSLTFHGRDVFAPVGAWLSTGKESADFGEIVTKYARLQATAPELLEHGHWQGRILNIDRFGNLITSFPAALLQQPWTVIQISAGQLQIYSVHTAYASAAPGEPFAIVGSSDLVELSVNEGSAADLADVEIGDTVELILTRPDEA